MEKFLAGKELWSTLSQLSKNCRTRQMVAVPYLGKESSSLIKFRQNDVLLCALTEQNSKSGNIYPAEVRSLQNQRVRVYQRDNLHAKIYLFGNKVVICSANLSQSSKSRLDETGLLTNNPVIVKAVREWFNARLAEPVMPGWLKHCEEIYQPPKGGTPPIRSNVDPNRRRVWIIFGSTIDFPEFEDRFRKSGYENAKKHLEKPRNHDIEVWRFGQELAFLKEAKRGDLVIQAIKENKISPYKVSPHGPILGKKKFKNKNGTGITYLYIEMLKNYRKIEFEKFKGICSEAGLMLGNINRIKEILDRAEQDEILAAVSPEKLRKKIGSI